MNPSGSSGSAFPRACVALTLLVVPVGGCDSKNIDQPRSIVSFQASIAGGDPGCLDVRIWDALVQTRYDMVASPWIEDVSVVVGHHVRIQACPACDVTCTVPCDPGANAFVSISVDGDLAMSSGTTAGCTQVEWIVGD